MMVFTPGVRNASWGCTIAEITLSDNARSDEFREFGKKIADSTGSINFVVDTSLIDKPKETLRLLESLYPGAIAAALLIGGFLCCLMILQSSKEAAIMRVLGTTKRKTRSLLALEQALLGIAGLTLGVAALLTYNGAALSGIAPQLQLFAALFFATTLACAASCSTLATHRSPLELSAGERVIRC
jgi:ABC-type antimicrobial peptide transport system permease subunit